MFQTDPWDGSAQVWEGLSQPPGPGSCTNPSTMHITYALSPTNWRPFQGNLLEFHPSAVTASSLSHCLSSLHLPPAHSHCEKLSPFQAPKSTLRYCSGTSVLHLPCLIVPAPEMGARDCSPSSMQEVIASALLLRCSRNTLQHPRLLLGVRGF